MTAVVPVPKIPKWPFLVGDAALLGVAVWMAMATPSTGGVWTQALLTACVALGAWLAIIPFVMEYRRAADLAEFSSVEAAVQKIQNLEQLAAQISGATAQWQGVQELSAKTTDTARQIGEVVAHEARSFAEFLKKANDSEKAALRLEVEKLRRGEGEWLQMVVRMLDHTFALYGAAVRSGQPNLIEQIGGFQAALRDVVRRAGLLAFAPAPNEPFNPQVHQPADAKVTPPEGACVAETVAVGYTFQGQILRRAAVAIQTVEPKSNDPSLPPQPSASEPHTAVPAELPLT